eukprot:5090077-Pleurochrysis_carterae.AAC.1
MALHIDRADCCAMCYARECQASRLHQCCVMVLCVLAASSVPLLFEGPVRVAQVAVGGHGADGRAARAERRSCRHVRKP